MSNRADLPPPPSVGDVLPASRPSPDTLDLLAMRRSTPIALMGEPGPDARDLSDILRIGLRVPDHRKLGPWRILVIEGDARAQLGEALAQVWASENGPDVPAERMTEERGRFLRAPVVLAVVSSPVVCPKGTPVWEQELSSGAVCLNLLLAASALGWAGCWLSEWCAYSSGAARVLGLTDFERVAGFIYLGTARENPPERGRHSLEERVARWTPAASVAGPETAPPESSPAAEPAPAG